MSAFGSINMAKKSHEIGYFKRLIKNNPLLMCFMVLTSVMKIHNSFRFFCLFRFWLWSDVKFIEKHQRPFSRIVSLRLSLTRLFDIQLFPVDTRAGRVKLWKKSLPQIPLASLFWNSWKRHLFQSIFLPIERSYEHNQNMIYEIFKEYPTEDAISEQLSSWWYQLVWVILRQARLSCRLKNWSHRI